MGINEHFKGDRIEENDCFLTEDEEVELYSVLQELLNMQNDAMKNNPDVDLDVEDRVRNIAGMAFVAGRSFQTEQDIDIAEDLEPPRDEVEEAERKRLAKSILEAATYLLGD